MDDETCCSIEDSVQLPYADAMHSIKDSVRVVSMTDDQSVDQVIIVYVQLSWRHQMLAILQCVACSARA